MRAIWKGTVIAESGDTVIVEGTRYFPPKSLNRKVLRRTRQTAECHWKGTARFYDVVVDGEVNPSAAWYYPKPTPQAAAIRGHVAFWKGVHVGP